MHETIFKICRMKMQLSTEILMLLWVYYIVDHFPANTLFFNNYINIFFIRRTTHFIFLELKFAIKFCFVWEVAKFLALDK